MNSKTCFKISKMLFFFIIIILLLIIFCFDILYVIRPYDVIWSYKRFWQLSKNVENIPALFFYVG